ncbi:general substrate transporter [Truncatella angustata]|uniref:General substrate transporter n=1 Tax=Truncatella angustata TaxID=152316 RepID=A0A9P8UZP5_9PEZI|nr:general substrate transporter [Truncatella angustata]KAH6661162.1 general substrate transporter [Truncatella angustata]
MSNHDDQTSVYNRWVIAFAALGSTTYGYGAAVFGATIGQPGWYQFFGLPPNGEPGYVTVTTPVIATANGLLSAGAACACLIMMWSGDYFGRIRNIQAGCFLGLLGGALQGGSTTLAMFQAGRFIMGLSIGTMVTITPMYLSEISSPRSRGWLVGHHAIFLVFGYMLSGWVSYGVYFASNLEFGWRFPLCLQVAPPLILLLGSPWLPRSPRWLAFRGKDDEAWRVLRRLRKCATDQSDIVAKKELLQIQEQIKLDREKLSAWGGHPWKAVLLKKSYRKRMIIGFLTQWGAEFGGPLVINNYSVILYNGLGQTGPMPLLLSAVWLTFAGVILNPGGAWLHDRVNSRRWMYMIGFIGVAITTACLTAMIACFGGTDNKIGNGAGIAFIFLYLVFQGTFCDTTMYIYISEIFPTEIRSIGMGWSLLGQFIATIILLQTAPLAFASVGWRFFLLIICWSIVFVPVIYFYFPETAALSLEAVEQQFGDEIAPVIQQQNLEKGAGRTNVASEENSARQIRV